MTLRRGRNLNSNICSLCQTPDRLVFDFEGGCTLEDL